jgi:hypothetical protein
LILLFNDADFQSRLDIGSNLAVHCTGCVS